MNVGDCIEKSKEFDKNKIVSKDYKKNKKLFEKIIDCSFWKGSLLIN